MEEAIGSIPIVSTNKTIIRLLMDNNKKSIAKAISWRIIGSIIAFLIGYFLTHDAAYAGGIALGDAAFKFVLYYFHERIWNHIDF
jgi:uncharacterized membrane protein